MSSDDASFIVVCFCLPSANKRYHAVGSFLPHFWGSAYFLIDWSLQTVESSAFLFSTVLLLPVVRRRSSSRVYPQLKRALCLRRQREERTAQWRAVKAVQKKQTNVDTIQTYYRLFYTVHSAVSSHFCFAVLLRIGYNPKIVAAGQYGVFEDALLIQFIVMFIVERHPLLLSIFDGTLCRK